MHEHTLTPYTLALSRQFTLYMAPPPAYEAAIPRATLLTPLLETVIDHATSIEGIHIAQVRAVVAYLHEHDHDPSRPTVPANDVIPVPHYRVLTVGEAMEALGITAPEEAMEKAVWRTGTLLCSTCFMWYPVADTRFYNALIFCESCATTVIGEGA